jgi:hypothetical protein
MTGASKLVTEENPSPKGNDRALVGFVEKRNMLAGHHGKQVTVEKWQLSLIHS